MDWKEFSLRIKYLSSSDQQKVESAFEMGKEAHNGQLRASGEPYFTHPASVAAMLADMEADADTVIAALLHDTVEDTSLTLKEIDKQFDGKVTDLIDGVTKLERKDIGESVTLDEKIETLRKIFTFMEQDVRIMVIKLVDRLHNIQTVQYFPKEKQKTYAQETMAIYVKIAERLSMEDLRDELEEICLSVLEPELFEELKKLHRKNEKLGEKMLPNIQGQISDATKLHPESIHFEHKSWDKLKTQLEAGSGPITGVSALTLTIVNKSIEECYQFLGVIHQLYRRKHLSFQDFINSPMMNGYRGLQTTVILEDGTRILVKIRTEKMEAYAHRGITTHCFDSKAVGFQEYLPWTKHIAPLSEGTIDRSEEFWESLQSDILGESIVIHGMGDKAILVPAGSTVLDGAFYVYEHKALQLKKIHVDGKDASFAQPLESGISLEINIAKKKTVRRDWLQWINSGLAAAIIRDGLAEQSDQKKLKIGKELLQEVMTTNKKGYIEEFNQGSIRRGLISIGYDSIEDAYLAMGEGRVEPQDVYKAIFSEKKKVDPLKQKLVRITYTFPIKAIEVTKKLAEIRRQYSDNFRTIRFSYDEGKNIGRAVATVKIAPEEQKRLVADLETAGVNNVEVHSGFSSIRNVAAIVFVICLWGLDPIFARYLLLTSISPYDLTFIRFATFFVAATLFYSLHTIFSGQKFKPLSLKKASLGLSGIALFVTALSTYLALVYISPTQYILFVLGGTIVPAIFSGFIRKKYWNSSVVIFGILAIILTILMFIQGSSVIGSLFASLGGLAFAFYSIVSKRYQIEEGRVQARYPAFLFWLSIISLPLILLLLPFTQITILPMYSVLMAIGFVIIFNVVPYGIYYALQVRIAGASLEQALLFTAIPTIIAEAIIHQTLVPLIAIPVFLVLFWQYRYNQKISA